MTKITINDVSALTEEINRLRKENLALQSENNIMDRRYRKKYIKCLNQILEQNKLIVTQEMLIHNFKRLFEQPEKDRKGFYERFVKWLDDDVTEMRRKLPRITSFRKFYTLLTGKETME